MIKSETASWLAIALCVLFLASSVALLAGCGGTEAPTAPPATDTALPPASSPTPEPSPTAPPDTPAPEADGTPAETLAGSGAEVYATECAECHGEQGEGLIGPALIGGGANLAAFGTVQGLYNYVHLAMPQDAPGSLTEQQYLEIIAYLLLENGMVQGDAPLSLEDLSDIPLE